MESGVLRAKMAPVSLDALARDAVELYEPVVEEAGSSIELEVQPVEVKGERHLLAHAITNLLDNAVKYAAAAGPIRVRVARGPDGPTLEVADRGPGIPPEARARVTERFVRLDASRAQPGTGLGLSFVDAVAHLHGARLVLGDNEPGLVVRLVFPSA
jgi:signal transduction histidine kinase